MPVPRAGRARRPAASSPLQWAAELLHIVRPLVYALLMRGCGARGGARSWLPLLVSLGLEAASARLSAAAMCVSR